MPLGPTHVLMDRIHYARPRSRMKIVIIAVGIAELSVAGMVLDVPYLSDSSTDMSATSLAPSD
jgi:hypothetical protein